MCVRVGEPSPPTRAPLFFFLLLLHRELHTYINRYVYCYRYLSTHLNNHYIEI